LSFACAKAIINRLIDRLKGKAMGRVITATEARIHFGELIRDVVEKQQVVIVERGGKPQVVVLSIDEYENFLARQAQREDWRTLLAQAHERIRADLGGRKLPPPEDIIREMPEERDAQPMDLC
jgi:prevent-host-death family protein